MKTSKFTDEQIAMALRQAEAGTPVGEICRELGLSEQSFYRWKKRFGALGVSELRELRQLREENRNLKGLVADLSLDKTILHEALRKNGKARRPARTGAVGAGSVPAIRTSGLPRGARRTVHDRYRSRRPSQQPSGHGCVNSAGGLAGEPQAGLSAVPRGGVGAPTAPAAAASQCGGPRPPAGADAAESAVGDGFHARHPWPTGARCGS
jgi:putative transposase